jgi:hypothetical protein
MDLVKIGNNEQIITDIMIITIIMGNNDVIMML